MKLQIIVPKQKTLLEDVEIERKVVIVGEVTGFWAETEDEKNFFVLKWGLNPNGLTFSTFPDVFTSIVLSKYPHNSEFRLIAEYEYTDPDDGELTKEEVVFKVASVEEVSDFPSALN